MSATISLKDRPIDPSNPSGCMPDGYMDKFKRESKTPEETGEKKSDNVDNDNPNDNVIIQLCSRKTWVRWIAGIGTAAVAVVAIGLYAYKRSPRSL